MSRTFWIKNNPRVYLDLGSESSGNCVNFSMDDQCNYWPPSPPCTDMPELSPAIPSVPVSPLPSLPPKTPMFVLPDQFQPAEDNLTKRYQEIVADRDSKLKAMSEMRDDFYKIQRELEAVRAKNRRLNKLIEHMVRKNKAEEQKHEALKERLSHISDYMTFIVTTLDDVDHLQPQITEFLAETRTPPS
jgi:hypothetical protein